MFCFVRDHVLIARASLILESFLGKRTIARSNFSETQPKHSQSYFISRTVYNTYPSVLSAVWFRSVLSFKQALFDLRF